MNLKTVREGRCGKGVKWLLCDRGALASDPPFVHVSAAVTWLAQLARARPTPPDVRRRLDVLFGTAGVNTWGLLYDALVSPQPKPGDTSGQPLSRILDAVLPRSSGRLFDVGVHVRHRREQPQDALELNAAACVAHALERVETRAPRLFLATEQPARLPQLMAKIRSATRRTDLVFDYVNASAFDRAERLRLNSLARTDARAVNAGRDWGPLGHERWLSALDFYLLANSRVLVGALSSTFSELAAAAVHRSTVAWLYDPIFQLTGSNRLQHNWPADAEYLTDPGPHFRCLRADPDWPSPQYVRLRLDDARDWLRTANCDAFAPHGRQLRRRGPKSSSPGRSETSHGPAAGTRQHGSSF